MARMNDLLIDATNAGMIEPEPNFVDPATCPHPPARLYKTWRGECADVLVIACCDCGKVLRATIEESDAPDA